MTVAPSNFPQRASAEGPGSIYWWLPGFDILAAIIFMVEVVLKTLDLGWGAYIDSPWNRLNTLSVCCAILDLVAPQGNPWVSLIRACRVLRALRVLKWFQSFKLVLRAFVGGWTYLVHVCALLAFFFFVSGVSGTEFFGGALRSRCTLPNGDLLQLPSHEPAAYCDVHAGAYLVGGLSCSAVGHALNVSAQCTILPSNMEGAGLLHFDNFGAAVFSSFIIGSIESWVSISYWLVDSVSSFSLLYGVGVIICINWLVFNIFVSVICGLFSSSWAAYEREQKKRHRRQILRQAAAASKSILKALTESSSKAVANTRAASWKVVASRSSTPQSASPLLQAAMSDSFEHPEQKSSLIDDSSIPQKVIHMQSVQEQLPSFATPKLLPRGASRLGSADRLQSQLQLQLVQKHAAQEATESHDKSSDLLWAEFKEMLKGFSAFRAAATAYSRLRSCVNSARCVVVLRRLMVLYKKESLVFDWFCIGLVGANFLVSTAALSNGGSAGNSSMLLFQTVVNFVAVLELLLRIMLDGLSWLRAGYHAFEALLVAIGFVGSIAHCATFSRERLPSRLVQLAMVIPVFRVLRIVASLRVFPAMHSFLLMMKRASNALLTVILINVYISCLFAWVAMQVLGHRTMADEASAIQKGMSFESFPRACFTLFAVGSGETWTDIAFTSIERSGTPGGIVIITFYLVAALIMLPLLVANIVTSVSVGEDERKRNQAIDFVRHWKRARHAKLQEMRRLAMEVDEHAHPSLGEPISLSVAHLQEHAAGDAGSVDSTWLEATSLPSVFLNVDPLQDTAMRITFHITVSEYEKLVRARFRSLAKRLIFLQRFGGLQNFARRFARASTRVDKTATQKKAPPMRAQIPTDFSSLLERMPRINAISALSAAGTQCTLGVTERLHNLKWAATVYFRAQEGITLGCVSPKDCLWKLCNTIESSPVFDVFNVVVVGVFVWVVSQRDAVAFDDQLRWLNIAEGAIACVFSLELCIRLVQHGAFFTQHAYLLTGWGVLDLMTSLAAMTSTIWMFVWPPVETLSPEITFLSIIRIVRLLRFFSVLQKLETTKELVRSMQQAGRELLFGCVFLLVVLISFALVGTTVFSGQLSSCNDVSVTIAANCTGVFVSEGFMTHRVWQPPSSNFDSVWNSLEALFEVMTLEGYVDIALQASEHSFLGSWSTVYFTVVVATTSFILLQFLVGTVLGNIKDADSSATQAQGEWDNVLAYVNQLSPSMPVESLAATIADNVQNFKKSSLFKAVFKSQPDTKQNIPFGTHTHAELKRMMSNDRIRVAAPHGIPLFGKNKSTLGSLRTSSVSSLQGVTHTHHHQCLSIRSCQCWQGSHAPVIILQLRQIARDISVPCDAESGACSAKGRRFHSLHSNFERVVFVAIALHSALLMSTTTPMDSVWIAPWQWLRFFLVVCFMFELCVRVFADGPQRFIKRKLNIVDSIAVASAGVSWLVPASASLSGLSRILLSLRVLRCMLVSPSLHVLLDTLGHSSKAIASVTALLVVSIVLYAFAGMELFGHIGPQHVSEQQPSTADLSYAWLVQPTTPELSNTSVLHQAELNTSSILSPLLPYEALGRHVHFQTAFTAIFTMFRASTGEDWQNIYHDLRRTHPLASNMFFFSFMLLCGQVLLNYFLAVVILRFDRCWSLVRGQVTYADLVRFQKIWLKPEYSAGSEFMSFSKTKQLIQHFAQQNTPDGLQRARAVYHGGSAHDIGTAGENEDSDHESDMPEFSPSAAAELELPFNAMLSQATPGLGSSGQEEQALREQAMHMAMSSALKSAGNAEAKRTQRSTIHAGVAAGLGALRRKAQGLVPVAKMLRDPLQQTQAETTAAQQDGVLQNVTSAVTEVASAVSNFVNGQIENTANVLSKQGAVLREVFGGEQPMTEFQANTLVGLQSRLWWSMVREDLRDSAVSATAHLMLLAHKAQVETAKTVTARKATVVPMDSTQRHAVKGRIAVKTVTAAAIFKLGIRDSFRSRTTRAPPTQSAAVVRGSTMSNSVVKLRAMRKAHAQRTSSQPSQGAAACTSAASVPSSETPQPVSAPSRPPPGNDLQTFIQAASQLPDSALLVPFQAVIASLALWHVGPEALQPEQALQRAMSIKRWHQHIIVSRIQAHWRRTQAKRAVQRKLESLLSTLGQQIRLQRCARHIQQMWTRHKLAKQSKRVSSAVDSSLADLTECGQSKEVRARELPPIVVGHRKTGQAKVKPPIDPPLSQSSPAHSSGYQTDVAGMSFQSPEALTATLPPVGGANPIEPPCTLRPGQSEGSKTQAQGSTPISNN